MDYDAALVIDIGSELTKVGYGGDGEPTKVIPSIVARNNNAKQSQSISRYTNSSFIDSSQSQRGNMTISHPIQNGIVTNWDNFEKLLYYIFECELRIDSSEFPMLLTESLYGPRANREKMAEIMFETFNVPATYIALQSVLSLYATDRTTGVVLECGAGVTYAVPVYEGFALPHAISRLDLAGNHLTNYLSLLLNSRGYSFDSNTEEYEVANIIKEKFSYVAIDYEKELKVDPTTIEQSYTLPNGDVITVGNERFKCAELLFQPSQNTSVTKGVHTILNESIKKCNIDIVSDLYNNVIISGGTTKLSGLKERLQKELDSLVTPKSIKVKIDEPMDKKFGAWIGGSVLVSLPTFDKMWISKNEYFDTGPSIIHKCF